MDSQRRKELLEEYKKIKIYMGIVQITNDANGKVFLAGYPNLKNKWQSIKGQLDAGRFMNLALQREWKEYGPDSFSFEVLEERSAEDVADVRWEVHQMLGKWLDKIQPYGEKGYNKVQ